jgi:hypothetical protein
MAKRFLIIFTLLSILPALFCCKPTEPLYPLDPQVLMLSPDMGSRFAPGPVKVKVYTENIKLVDKAGQSNVPGEGHLIYYLDVALPVYTGASAVPAAGAYKISTETSYTWADLPAGEHQLAVQLVNNDNTPIRYPSAVYVNITIE